MSLPTNPIRTKRALLLHLQNQRNRVAIVRHDSALPSVDGFVYSTRFAMSVSLSQGAIKFSPHKQGAKPSWLYLPARRLMRFDDTGFEVSLNDEDMSRIMRYEYR